ncbi:MAG: ABC transporter substrate-binding protein [Lachnospiraceae bacterium]|nr:ABC transporter substrate-binding protein [Lachnospiraceae bacterium]
MKRNSYYSLISILIIVILLVFIFAGETLGLFLTPTIDNESVSADENLITVGISQLGSESVWRSANTESIQKSLSRENGYFAIFSNARQKQDNQIKAIRNYISQGVDYIVFSPVMEDGWESVLTEAKEAKIPVILMDRTVNVSDDTLYVTHVGSDMKEEGIKAGKWLESYLKNRTFEDDTVNIVILKGTRGSTAEIGRSNGFHEISRNHPEWKILEEVDADFTTAKAREEMTRMLRKYPRIDVLISQNDDMTFGAIDSFRQAGITTGINGDVTIVSFDACHEALTMVYNGVINVDIECNPIQGEYVSEVIKKLENGETVDKEYFVEEQVFTKENVKEALEKRQY